MIGASIKKEIDRPLYLEDVTEIPRGQVEFCGNEDVMLRQEHRHALSRVVSPRMTKTYIRACYEEMKKELIVSYYSRNVWIINGNGDVVLFVGFVQLLLDKMDKTQRSTALIGCPIHDILFTVSASRRHQLVGNGSTLLKLPPVCCSR